MHRAGPPSCVHRLPWRPDRPGAITRPRSSSGCGRYRSRSADDSSSLPAITRRCCCGSSAAMRGWCTDWLRFGGAECLRSYGVDPDRLRADVASARRSRLSARPSRRRMSSSCEVVRRHVSGRRLSVCPCRHPSRAFRWTSSRRPTCAGSGSRSSAIAPTMVSSSSTVTRSGEEVEERQSYRHRHRRLPIRACLPRSPLKGRAAGSSRSDVQPEN